VLGSGRAGSDEPNERQPSSTTCARSPASRTALGHVIAPKKGASSAIPAPFGFRVLPLKKERLRDPEACTELPGHGASGFCTVFPPAISQPPPTPGMTGLALMVISSPPQAPEGVGLASRPGKASSRGQVTRPWLP